MVLQTSEFVDKYLMVVLIFLFASIPISLVDPGTGEFRDPPRYELFYGAIAGIIIVIFYNSFKERKKRQKDRAKKRSKK